MKFRTFRDSGAFPSAFPGAPGCACSSLAAASSPFGQRIAGRVPKARVRGNAARPQGVAETRAADAAGSPVSGFPVGGRVRDCRKLLSPKELTGSARMRRASTTCSDTGPARSLRRRTIKSGRRHRESVVPSHPRNLGRERRASRPARPRALRGLAGRHPSSPRDLAARAARGARRRSTRASPRPRRSWTPRASTASQREKIALYPESAVDAPDLVGLVPDARDGRPPVLGGLPRGDRARHVARPPAARGRRLPEGEAPPRPRPPRDAAVPVHAENIALVTRAGGHRRAARSGVLRGAHGRADARRVPSQGRGPPRHSRRHGRLPLEGRRVTRFFSLVTFSHTIFALPFALLAAVLAAGGVPPPGTLFWILVAMVGARSAAMAFNRIADRAIDAVNPRTEARDIPAGRVSVASASAFCFALGRRLRSFARGGSIRCASRSRRSRSRSSSATPTRSASRRSRTSSSGWASRSRPSERGSR